MQTTQDVKITGPGDTTPTQSVHINHFNHILLEVTSSQLVGRICSCHRVKGRSHNGRDGCEEFQWLKKTGTPKMCCMKVHALETILLMSDGKR